MTPITDTKPPRCKHFRDIPLKDLELWRCPIPQCPDCDAVKMFSDSAAGNGMCSACHGTGFARFFDAIALELLNVEQPPCEECNGSGQCQTCSGTGVIEAEIKIAA